MNIEDLYLADFEPEIYETTCKVSDIGTIHPIFKLDSNTYTSGELKYFQQFKNKQIKVTIEILKETKWIGNQEDKTQTKYYQKILNFNLLQLAIGKYISKYSIDELPIYTMHIKIKYYNTNKG